MHAPVIVHGEAGWTAKKLLLKELLLERPGPPHLYHDILILVPSSRARRVHGKLLLDLVEELSGSAAFSPPDIQTLHLFLQRLYARSRGPALIDETARLVLLEWIVKDCTAGRPEFGGNPGLIAPSLAAAVAELIEQLGNAGVPADRLAGIVDRSDFGDKPQARLLVAVYERYTSLLAERGLTDLAGMLRLLAERFDPAWLAGYRRIVIDGMHDATDLQAAVLRKILACGNCTVLLDAPSANLVRGAAEDHPLRLLRELVAKLGLPAGDSTPPEDRDAAFLASAVFPAATYAEAAAGAPPEFARDLRVLSAVNLREEVSLIARSVKDSLRAGMRPDTVLVAFPSLDAYGPLAEEIFRDFGIPYNRALGRQLSSSAVATSLVALLEAVRENFSGAALLRIFGSPFLRFAQERNHGPALDRLRRGRRILDGRDTWLKAARSAPEGEDVLTGPLTELFTALDPFLTQDALPLSCWMERLAELVVWSGLADRVELIKGPLNANLQAFRKLTDTTAALARAARLFPEYRCTFDEWLFLLRKTLMHARFQVPPDDEGGVQILGIEESAGLAWSEVFLGGLVDGAFPLRRGQNIFLPEKALEPLGMRPLEQARLNASYQFYRLLLAAPRVTLTWPENQGERPVVASPFLAELKALDIAGLLNRGRAKTRNLQFSLRPQEARSVPELAKAVAVAGMPDGLAAVLDADLPGMAGMRAAVRRPSASRNAPVPAVGRRTFAVTELEDYLTCPYDYYVRHVLGIAPLEEVTGDLSPRDRGSRVHGILKSFYEAWRGPVAPDNREQARELLLTLAERAYRRDADTFRNRREKDLFVTTMAERFLSAEIGFWIHGFTPAYLEQKIEDFSFALADGSEITLHAKIDRIDVDGAGNFIIVDYKTGGYPQPKKNGDQEIFQLPVYAVMAQSLAAAGPTLRKPVGLAYYDLAGKFGGPARDVVLFDKDAGFEHPAVKPQASARSAADFAAILAQSVEKARKAAEGILAGRYSPQPRTEDACRYCENEIMCERERDE